MKYFSFQNLKIADKGNFKIFSNVIKLYKMYTKNRNVNFVKNSKTTKSC